MDVEVEEDLEDTSDEEEGFSDLEMDEETSLLKGHKQNKLSCY